MKFPELVPNWVCTVPITLTLEREGVGEDGEPTSITVEGFCNYQDGGQVVYTPDQKIIEIKGRAYFNGDICPQLSNITGGEAELFGEKREIHQGFKCRNPDGTINHTEILLK